LRLADVVIDAMRWLPATVAKTATVEVVDDGVGIGPDVLDRIFDPFFTTRAVGEGRGSGLGLALSRSIVEAHGGTTTVESEPGKGSTFRVEVPAAPDEA
jgi:signal transduction histidine kinase